METMVLTQQVIYPLDHFMHGAGNYAPQVKALAEMNKVAQVASEQVAYAMSIYERIETMITPDSAPERALRELTHGYIQSITGIVRESHQALYHIMVQSFRRLFVVWVLRLLFRKPTLSSIAQLSLTAQRQIYTQTQTYVQRIESLAAAMQAKG